MPASSPIPPSINLKDCASEPIHRPGAIQPYGSVLIVDPSSLQVVEGALSQQVMSVARDGVLGQQLDVMFDGFFQAYLDDIKALPVGKTHLLGSHDLIGAGAHYVLVHRSESQIIVDLEERVAGDTGSLEDLYPLIQAFTAEIEQSTNGRDACDLAARYTLKLCKFDRTLVYQFDRDWNGEVIAEHRNQRLPSYLGLHFPESDIPAQARELYRRHRVRLIADSDYVAIPLKKHRSAAQDGSPDLSQSVLRSVSPVHLRYMKNMDTGASMSISIVREGKLWGLISCHNLSPMRVPFHVRTACELIAQILSLHIALKEQALVVEQRISRRSVQLRLLGRMAGTEDFMAALGNEEQSLLALTGATGAAIFHGGQCIRLGASPNEDQIQQIASWLSSQSTPGDVFSSDHLGRDWQAGVDLADVASGLLAIPISQLHNSYVLWFRPEFIQTVHWGGDPRKQFDGGQLSPRSSFESWKEIVRHQSVPWSDLDRDAALELRTAIVDIVLRKAEEMAALNDQLMRSNKELEAFSYSVSHDLRAPFRHIVGYSELLETSLGERISSEEKRYLGTIVESATSAGTLVDDLLSFSQMGRLEINRVEIDSRILIEDVRSKLRMEMTDRAIRWDIGPMHKVLADPTMIRLVWQNLLSNAIKFTREEAEAEIVIRSEAFDGEVLFSISDNGCGFDMRYVDKLFGVFQRLHHVDEFEGTGIGLANVSRIVARHGGRVWAQSEIDNGATFSFTLPKSPSGATS